MTSAEKFEILSAYLDDEASDEERLLVEQWIEQDPQFRQQYQAQLKLKAAIRQLPSSLFGNLTSSCDIQPADEPTEDLRYKLTSPSSQLRSLRPTSAASKSSACRQVQSKWRDILIVLAALSAAAIASFCYSSTERTRWVQPGRAPSRIKRTDAKADGVLCHRIFQSALESC